MFLTGCAARSAVTIHIPVQAIRSVDLVQCSSTTPSSCKRVLVKYVKGAEQVHLEKPK